MNNFNYRNAAQFLKAFSHPTRLSIITELLKGKKCVNNIKEIIKLKQSDISQHLSLLRLLNIVDFKKDGNRKCYFLKNPELVKNLFKIIDKI